MARTGERIAAVLFRYRIIWKGDSKASFQASCFMMSHPTGAVPATCMASSSFPLIPWRTTRHIETYLVRQSSEELRLINGELLKSSAANKPSPLKEDTTRLCTKLRGGLSPDVNTNYDSEVGEIAGTCSRGSQPRISLVGNRLEKIHERLGQFQLYIGPAATSQRNLITDTQPFRHALF